MLKHVPNALTLTRLILAPVIAFAVWQAYAVSSEGGSSPFWPLLALGLFVLAALTDLVDGMAARAFNAESKFGRIIDPIADKALVGLPLIAIAVVASQIGQELWWLAAACTAIIVLRDIIMTLWRLLSKDGEGVRVSRLAKWKTAVEMAAVGLPILMVALPSILRMSGAGDGLSGAPEIGVAMMFLWMALLIIAAALSVMTASQYAFGKPNAEDPLREQESVETAPKASLTEPPPSDAEVAPWAGT
jgi:CDP-diacylglycerol--glycerol-3-phosphate 3-phosphatidyltransferase